MPTGYDIYGNAHTNKDLFEEGTDIMKIVSPEVVNDKIPQTVHVQYLEDLE